jgi:hypothetical protein
MKSQKAVAARLAIGVAIAAWVVSLASVTVAQDTPYFFIRNHGNPKLFLHNRGGEVVASAIEPQECIGGQWALEPGLGDTTVRIRHRERDVYLQVEDGRLVLGALRPDWAPRWFVEAAERQLAVRFRNAQTDLYLALRELIGPPAAVPIDPDRDVTLLEWELVAGADCSAAPLVTAPALRPLIVLPGRVSPIRVPGLQPPPAPFPPGERPPPGKQLPPLKPPPEKFPRPDLPKTPPDKFPRPDAPDKFPRPDAPDKFPRPDAPDRFPRPDAPDKFPRPGAPDKTIPRAPLPPPETCKGGTWVDKAGLYECICPPGTRQSGSRQQYICEPPRAVPELPELVDTGPPPRSTPRGPTIRGLPAVHYSKRPPVQRFRPNAPRATKRPIVQRPPIVRPKPAPRPRVAPARRSPRAR